MRHSGREPFQNFRFLGDLAGHLDLAIHEKARCHEDPVLAELLDILDVHHFRIQTILLDYVLN